MVVLYIFVYNYCNANFLIIYHFIVQYIPNEILLSVEFSCSTVSTYLHIITSKLVHHCRDGTAEFMAPEKVNKEAVGVPADIWGVGTLAFILSVYHANFSQIHIFSWTNI